MITETKVIKTTTPQETVDAVLKVLQGFKLSALGIASFGPIELNTHKEKYGHILATPKKLWIDCDMIQPFKTLGVPIEFQTDVNAAALGELRYGEHGLISSCCYVTVGTGIGVGVVINSQAVTGLTHPEGGHIRVERHKYDQYKGNCPYHKDCLEGLANAAAVADRVGCHPSKLGEVADDHNVWEIEAFYLGQLCAQLTLILSPELIILGGGVLHRTRLFVDVRKVCVQMLNGYIQASKILNEIDNYIVQSRFDRSNSETSSGAIGSLELARRAFNKAAKFR